jgi:O-antigen/teichoic acid export membrane protein
MLSSFVGHHFISLGYTTPMYLLPVFVAARLSLTDTAYFYTTWMLGSFLFMVSPAVAASLFAEGSHAADSVLRKARASAVIIGMLLGPIMLVFFLGGHYIISLFGPGYALHGLLLLTILTVSAVPDAITNIYVSVLRVQKRLRWAALFNLGMGSLVLALAWILLPLLGIVGAGYAWLIAQVTGSLVVGAHGIWAYFRRRFRVSYELPREV